MKRAAKKKASRALAHVTSLPKIPAIVRDDEMLPGRPDVIANGMMGNTRRMVEIAAAISADVAAGAMTPARMMEACATINQGALILAHQGLGLQAEAKRLQDIREEERRVALLANKSGEAMKLLRILVSTFGEDWRILRQNDETGVTANIPIGKLILQTLDMREEQLEHMPPPPELTEAQHQRETMKARLRSANGSVTEPVKS